MKNVNLTEEQAKFLRVLADRPYALHPLAVYMQVYERPTGTKLQVLRHVQRVFKALHSAGYVEQRTSFLRGEKLEMYIATEHGRKAVKRYDS